jgi:hypothetical protein
MVQQPDREHPSGLASSGDPGGLKASDEKRLKILLPREFAGMSFPVCRF